MRLATPRLREHLQRAAHVTEANPMIELTRTVRQWWATARRLEHREIGRPDLAAQIRETFPKDVHPDTHVRVSFLDEDATVIEGRTPETAWWMPKGQEEGDPPRDLAEEAGEAAVDTAASIIREHQRRPD